jgi:hypothetical protein
MAGERCEHSTGRTQKSVIVVIVPQRGTKVNIDEIITDLKAEMQTLEDLKTQVSEAQEDIRNTICRCQMLKEVLNG